MNPSISRRDLLGRGAQLSLVPILASCGVSARSAATGVVEIAVDGNTFQPRVELIWNSPAEIRWIDLDTQALLGHGLEPTLAITSTSRVGLVCRTGEQDAYDQVVTLNFGFNPDDDGGRYNIGRAYKHSPQPVTGVANLQLVTGLQRFCAASTRLSGVLDVSGLKNLRFIECYQASVDSVVLSGCSGLLRLCIESNRLSQLDLNPVRRNLRDLRAAIQRSDHAGLTFSELRGPMEYLYHFCIRDQPVHQIVPHSQLPVVEEYWTWGTELTASEEPKSPLLRSFASSGNAYDQASVDLILEGVARQIPRGPGTIDVSGQTKDGAPAAPPSEAGRRAATRLTEGGWSVTTN